MPDKNTPGGISSDALQAKTGRGWDEWIKALDQHKAHELSHKEIAKLVHDKFQIGAWWSQMVTVGYEQAKGLREVHEKADGFSANLSRTVPISLNALFALWSDGKSRKKLMGAAKYKVTTTNPNKWLRLAFGDGTRADVGFYAKGDGKSQVTIQHNKLRNAEDVAARKAYWSEVMDRMKAAIE